MPKQDISINFSQGIQTKTDPWQLPPGQFLSLENTVFNKGGMLQKRNGYGELTSLPNNNATYLTTFNGNLTAIGDSVQAYSSGSAQWVEKGNIEPVQVSVLPLIRNNLNQVQCDSAIAPNGLVCTAYSETQVDATVLYKYVIADSTTGQNIIEPTQIPVSSGTVTGSPRVFLLGSNFVLVFTNLISSTSHLQYIAISYTNPTQKTTNVNIASAYSPTPILSWDGYVANQNLYIAYNTATPTINITYLTSSNASKGGAVVTPVVFSGVQASILSLCADNTIPQSPIIYCSSYYSGNTTVFVVDGSLNPIFKPVTAPVNGTVVNLASAAQNNLLTVFAEIANNYSFDSTIATNFIQGIEIVITPVPFYSVFSSGSSSITVSNSSELVNGMFLVDNTTPGNIPAGTFIAVSGTTVALYTNPASPTPTATAGNSATSPGDQLVACSIIASTDGYIIRGVGLASKAFIVDGSIYFLASQQSAYQSTYFLVNGSKSITNALTEYSFTVNPLNQSVDFGTVYSNGINTYVVVAQTLAGATTLFCSGSGSPAPGYTTLALVGGTGQAVISASSSTVITTVSPPVVSAKLAYENGAGPYVAGSAYCPLGLPSVTVNGDLAQVSYLYKDLIESLNTLANPQQTTTGGIYSQTGIQLANFTIATQGLDSAEIGNSLILSGGFGWMYDGYLPVEQNFFLWPENVEASLVADPTPTGTALNASKALTVSSGTNITVGMNVYDTTNSSYIPSGTVVTAVSGTAVTLSKATTHAISGDTITFTGNVTAQQYYYQAVYEWADNQGNVHRSAPSIPVTVTATAGHTSIKLNIPTLRLTYKTANPVKIVVYRWSAANQTYYQTFLAQGYPNSITSPILNNTSVDSVVFEDVASDSAIIGNSIIYTTGGVVEDVNPPASNLITLFDTRVWMVDAEDPNLLWFSKQVIENTPVEMSDLFTFYVAPTTAAQGSTGPITALSVMDDKLIIFKKNAIYYINGIGPDNTGNSNGYSQPIFITSTVGCSNQQSIVFINDGLMFQSDKGIWLLGRNTSTQYIGSPVEEFNGGVVQSAVNVPETNQVRFTLSTGQTLMYDYFYGQWGTFVNVPAVSSTIFQGVHTYLDSYGKIYQETPGQYLDGSKPVLVSFKTSWFNLANLQGYERFYDFYILARYLTPHFLLCSVAYDYNDSILHRKLISPTNFSSATPSGFGVPTPFGSPANREQWRIHAKQQLCQSFQLTISEVFNPAYGTVPGAGFTMSGITAEVEIKRGTRPVKGGNSAGMS